MLWPSLYPDWPKPVMTPLNALQIEGDDSWFFSMTK